MLKNARITAQMSGAGVKIRPCFLQNPVQKMAYVVAAFITARKYHAASRPICRNGTDMVTITRKTVRTPILIAKHTANAVSGRGNGGYL